MNSLRPYLTSLTVLLLLFIVLLIALIATRPRTEEAILLEAKQRAVERALEDPYIDYVLDSVANARADSIVEERLKRLNPYTVD